MEKFEGKYQPIIDLLEDKGFLNSITNEYKGFITALCPFIYNPKILFIGINPGPGAFNEKNQKSKSRQVSREPIFPRILFSDKNIKQIDWLKDGNARGESINRTWRPYKWHERKKKVNNEFVKKLVEFFFAYYNIDENSDYNTLEKRINSEIFYSNLYPISTRTTKELDIILKKIADKKLILNQNETGDIKELKNFFRQRIIDLIEIINPEVIVCLGKKAFKDLTQIKLNDKLVDSLEPYRVKFRKNDRYNYPVYVIPRNGNWEGKIKSLGKKLRVL